MNALLQAIDGIQEVLGICPCCGELFRLAEAKFVFPQRPPRSCEYLRVAKLEEKVAAEDERLRAARERFDERMEKRRAPLIEAGRRKAKRKLKKIDPTFSGRGVDPQDVKVIFDPVEYIVFHGLNSERGVRNVELVSRAPADKVQEAVLKSIDRSVQRGDVEFETLHMRDDGSFEVKKA